MLDAYADRRLTIAPHFSVYREADDRLLLFGEQGGFRLTGATVVRLLPLLDGSRTVRELIAAFAPEDIRPTLERMIVRRYAVPVAADTPAHLAAFWAEGGRDPDSVAARAGAAPLAVLALGSGEPAGESGAAALADLAAASGLTIAGPETAELTVVLVDDLLQPTLADFARSQPPARRWLPVKPGGTRALIGPLFGPLAGSPVHPLLQGAAVHDDGGCFTCLARRLSERRPSDALVAAPPRGVRPAKGWTPASLATVRGLLVGELERLLHMAPKTEADSPDAPEPGADTPLRRHVLSLDPARGERSLHRVWRYADCPTCGETGTQAVARRPALDAGPLASDGGAGWRVWPGEQALARLLPVASPVTGIVSALSTPKLAALSQDELPEGLYVTTASQGARAAADHRENRRAGKPGLASGKGMTATQARISCLAEAVERYACAWTGSEPFRLATLAELGSAAVHPAALLCFSERQYAERERLNEAASSLQRVPLPFRDEAAIAWSPAWSLSEDAPRWVPTRYCYFDYRAEARATGEHAFCYADSNGCAAGATLAEAALQGFLEVVERDAVAAWWYGRAARPGVALEGIDDPFVETMRESYAGLGRGLHLLDLTGDLDIPVIVAVSTTQPDGGRPLLGMGAHFDPRIAAIRALTEVNQLLPLEPALSGQPTTPDLERWLAGATLRDQPYLAPLPDGHALRHVTEMRRPDVTGIDAALAYAGRRLRELGHDLLLLDYGRTDVPLAVAKVMVPGFRPFWPRRAPGRLYDMPLRQGWLSAPLTEAELNPLAFVM